MTTYDRREVTVRRVEYAIEAGSHIGTFSRVLGIAWANYCELTGIDRSRGQFDDWCTVHPRDEEIVISFNVETREVR